MQTCHLGYVDDYGSAHVVGDLPAHHHARGQVDEGRQIRPLVSGAQVSNVADQARAGLVSGEVSIEQIIAVVIVGALALNYGETPLDLGPQTRPLFR